MIVRSASKIKEINLIPLINVVFLLLIFFLVAGTIKSQDNIHIALPLSTYNNNIAPGEIILYIDDKQNIFLNETPVNVNTLIPQLSDLIQNTRHKTVSIKAENSVNVSYIVDLMDKARMAGALDAIIVTQHGAL